MVAHVDDDFGRRDHLRLASSQPLLLISGGDERHRTNEPHDNGTLRPAFTSIAVHNDGDRIEATATLALNGRVLTGSSIGDAADHTSVVARATLNAVSVLLDFEVTIDSALVMDITGHDVAVSILRIAATQTESALLVGSALANGDTEDATARSVLSALNRRLNS